MIQLFRKILCPIDFSDHSLAALDARAESDAAERCQTVPVECRACASRRGRLPAGATGCLPIP